jgi:nuclear pore complex protein Nup155
LEQQSYGFTPKGKGPEHGWMFKTLQTIKVPHYAIFSALHDFFEIKLAPWSSNKALSYLIEDIYALLRDWIKYPSPFMTGLYQAPDFPARIVDEAIRKYLVTIS